MNSTDVQMIVGVRYCADAGPVSYTASGTPNELADAFKARVPTAGMLREGFSMTVEFQPAPTPEADFGDISEDQSPIAEQVEEADPIATKGPTDV